MSELLKLEGTLKMVFDKGILIAIIISIAICIFHIGKAAISKLIRRYSKDKDNPQVSTLLRILRSIWKYFVLFIAAIAVLNVFGLAITATSLMAAAGAGGLVLGIGAQDFVKDIVNGFTIILENHFRVGDRVIINGEFGTITNMTLRTTVIVGEKHETFMIPNSLIGTVINYSKQNPRVFCYVYITDVKDVTRAMDVIKASFSAFKSGYASGGPKLMGVTAMYPYGTEIGVFCDGEIGHILDLKFDIYTHLANVLGAENVCFISDKTMMEVKGEADGV